MMLYPYDLPERLMSFCEYSNRFFMNESATRNIWRQFTSYCGVLLDHPSENPYEQLLCHAIRNEAPALIESSTRLNVHQYPALITCLRRLMHIESLRINEPLSLLLAAPMMMREKRLTQEQLLFLLNKYPEQQARLLFYATLYNASIDWHKILEEKTHGGLACLALSKQIKNISKTCSELYEIDNNIVTLRCWMMVDAESALTALPEHPILEEIIETIVLHGDANLLQTHAHKLLEIPNEFIIEALKLFFDRQIRTRPGLAQDASCLFETPDATAVKLLINCHFKDSHPYLLGQQRTPMLVNQLIAQCSGRSVDYFQLYARHHEFNQ